jgi:hypothetical protein
MGFFSLPGAVVVSSENGRVDLTTTGSGFRSAVAMVKNRSTQAYYGRHTDMSSTIYHWALNSSPNNSLTINGRRIDSINSTALKANYSDFQPGDVVFHTPGEYVAGQTGVARVVVSPATGYAQGAGATITTSAVVKAGNATIGNVDSGAHSVLPDDNIVVLGGGALGADLNAIVTAVDRAKSIISIAPSPAADVNPATLRHAIPVFREWGMDATRMKAAPTKGKWQIGEIVWNGAPAELTGKGHKYLVLGWICMAGGTPGTWKEIRISTEE